MYQLSYTNQFKKDYKLAQKRGYDLSKLHVLIQLLMKSDKIPAKYKEHPLKGDYKGYFDCLVTPDWIVIFRRDVHEKLVVLVRNGTHADLFG